MKNPCGERNLFMATLSIWHWLIVLVIVLLVFRTHERGSVGGNISAAVRNFRQAILGARTMHFNLWFALALVLLLCLLLAAKRLAA
jgi:TatA/E family protein of Tat protein translocase